jgi:hypothetical protein
MGLPTKDNKGGKGKKPAPGSAQNSKFIAKPGKQASMPKKKINTGSNRGS